MLFSGPKLEDIDKWASKGNVKKLIGALKSSDALIRRQTVKALSEIGGPQVIEFCRENARSSNEQMRWHVTQILGLIGSREAVKILDTVKDPLSG